MSNKIAILIPPYFWSSIPYDGMMLYDYLKKRIDIDLIMFKDDFRLHKVFEGYEKFSFDPNVFLRQNIKEVSNLENFFLILKDYDYVLTGVHLIKKILRTSMIPRFPSHVKKKIIMTDIGGLDILTTEGTLYADTFLVKGNIWKTWFKKMGIDNSHVTGCPHYDYYLHSDLIELEEARILAEDVFVEKYGLNKGKKTILIMPSNPANHRSHFDNNLHALENISSLAEKHGYQILIKTYPHDYVFYEQEKTYNGIYKRKFSNKSPQYEIIQKYVENSIVIDSQDHFSALLFSDVLFNITGSHVGWETYLSNTQSFSMNYKKQIYYVNVKFLPDYIKLPDDIVNLEVDNVEEVFSGRTGDKTLMSEYIDKSFSPVEILKFLKGLALYENTKQNN